ncbi:DUF5082 domain-containing protein [Bacillus mangrovi]|uniref:DUF5082 domain-containing protein n=1 Tax=Metabacillus mangrovi TaxID=1491830 RepID=A0A7X2S771_9BACI|nr:DUF5082 domain-containing protein [Metabacillus mangrovi]MTH54535.1 DUF5082 domain-containing protein [Metabacillus mangrovi]
MPDIIEMEARAARAAKQIAIMKKIESLQKYQMDLGDGMDELRRNKQNLKAAHETYLGQWTGKGGTAYKELAEDLNSLNLQMEFSGSETIDAINQEISRLQQELNSL